MELLLEEPTISSFSSHDPPIFKNIFTKEIPFNISQDNLSKDYNLDECFKFFHSLQKLSTYNEVFNNLNNKLIVIVRNPREVLLRHTMGKIRYKYWDGFDEYFKILKDFYNFKGDKLLIYYEDMILYKVKFIRILYKFLKIDNREKLKYVLNNINNLWDLSLNAKNRYWAGNKSNNKINLYYKDINPLIKTEFDNYINKKLQEFPLIKKRYNL